MRDWLISGPLYNFCRCQWPRGLSCGSAAARLLGLRVRFPPVACMSVSCECCVLSRRGLWCRAGSLVQRIPTECYVSDFKPETLKMRRALPTTAFEPRQKYLYIILFLCAYRAFLLSIIYFCTKKCRHTHTHTHT
jgi:hypothetical protein